MCSRLVEEGVYQRLGIGVRWIIGEILPGMKRLDLEVFFLILVEESRLYIYRVFSHEPSYKYIPYAPSLCAFHCCAKPALYHEQIL